MPLRDVTWKNPVTSTYITISRLPLKFLPSAANLFKDTDHPFRWFLAPYVHIYIVTSETLEAYKVAKAIIKQWVEFQSGIKRAYWLIIYIPQKPSSTEIHAKVFARMSADFYVERQGDRSVYVPQISSNARTPQSSYNDILSKIREGVVQSFQQKLSLYDTEIRRLDSFRGSPQLEFRQLFLVKESLALMYQVVTTIGLLCTSFLTAFIDDALTGRSPHSIRRNRSVAVFRSLRCSPGV